MNLFTTVFFLLLLSMTFIVHGYCDKADFTQINSAEDTKPFLGTIVMYSVNGPSNDGFPYFKMVSRSQERYGFINEEFESWGHYEASAPNLEQGPNLHILIETLGNERESSAAIITSTLSGVGLQIRAACEDELEFITAKVESGEQKFTFIDGMP
ncbi:MAG: hypothetical protein ISR65_11265 [Bacteriovoracaceae bacterium]|nr:hypothetical protein [Bacteriovoracaceae bacterium]